MLDLYQPCPCHQERKLKFCCGKDVVLQFSKVIDMLEGGQRLKAIQVMDKAIAQHGHRDCLSTIRFATELESGNPADAAALCESYVAENGSTSIAWTMRAMMAMEQLDLGRAVDHLQSALETLEPPSAMTCEALLSLGLSLARAGRPSTARDHFKLYLQFRPGPETPAAHYLQMVRSVLSFMPYEKHEWPLVPIPDGRPWSLEAAQALHWVEQGLWRKAIGVLHPLAAANLNEAVLWKNVAILAGRLHDQAMLHQAWGRYAECPGVSPEHAVEAELLSLLMSDVFAEEVYDEVILTYDLTDLPGFLEQATSDPRLERLAEDLLQPLSFRRDETPTAMMFAKVNLNPSQEAAEGESPASHLLGLAFYGKRTDRPAQMLLGVTEFPAVTERLAELVASYPQIDAGSVQRRVSGKIPKLMADFSADRLVGLKRADQDLAPEATSEAGWQDLLEQLPDYRTQLLAGQTFADAAQQPPWRRRVEALLLALEAAFSLTADVRPTIEQLRQRLGLPPRALINPKSVRLPDLSLEQFSRLDFSQMPGKMLAWASNTAMNFANINGLRSVVEEIERRVAAGDQEVRALPLADMYLFLAKVEGLPSRAVACLAEADKHQPQETHARCDWLVSAIEVSVGRRLGDPLIRYFSLLSEMAALDDYCFAAYVKMGSALGLEIPEPLLKARRMGLRPPLQSALTTAEAPGMAATENGPPETRAAATPAGESKLWLPGM